MCLPECQNVVLQNLTRRRFLGGSAAAALGVAGCHDPSPAWETNSRAGFPGFERVVDLTHTHSNRFPNYFGGTATVEKTMLFTTDDGMGWNLARWTLDEHAGTHIDAPFHRDANGITLEQILVSDLVVPLVVVDIRRKADQDATARLTLDDIRDWEHHHGRLPSRCCVAMLSGWADKVTTPEFINLGTDGIRRFPGFDTSAIEYLLRHSTATGIAVDTASLDHGPSTDFPVHTAWLGANHWGLENVASLDQLPPRGATLCCGAPKIEGATGGHSRVMALI
jgi:kynurenine formamidase